jgi:alpha-L-rhamnosidase
MGEVTGISARANIAVAELYELYINGEKIWYHRLDPVITRFDKRSLYVSFDVTKDLQEGENVIGVLLGNGWYNHQNLKNDPGEMNNQIPGESRR